MCATIISSYLIRPGRPILLFVRRRAVSWTLSATYTARRMTWRDVIVCVAFLQPLLCCTGSLSKLRWRIITIIHHLIHRERVLKESSRQSLDGRSLPVKSRSAEELWWRWWWKGHVKSTRRVLPRKTKWFGKEDFLKETITMKPQFLFGAPAPWSLPSRG